VGPLPYRLKRPTRQERGEETASGGLLVTDAVDRFALEHREKHKGLWFEADRLGGFCLLMKREVLAKASLFDDQSEPGVFNADAFSGRVRQAGYHLAGCRDLFVHHFGARAAPSR
jgi:O-antigen biosynthesis protein